MQTGLFDHVWKHSPPRQLAGQLDRERLHRTPWGMVSTLASFEKRLRVTPLRTGGSATQKLARATVGAPSLESVVFRRAAFGPTPDEVGFFRGLGETPRERLEAWVDWQLEPEAIDNGELELRLAEAGYETLDKSLEKLWTDHVLEEEDFDFRMLPIYETQSATILRAVYSRRQLKEVLADFWHNHFNVFGWHFLAGPVFVHYDREVIRPHVLGNFRDFLEAMTASPSMLFYLDNIFNSSEGPNENFAREVLELHTMGEESYFGAIPAADVPTDENGLPKGYTDEDVRELARCLTGWSLDEETGEFLYRWYWHDTGPKKVLGLSIPGGRPQLEDVRRVFDLLAVHPAVARFVCTKLCRRLVADDPPESLIETAETVFLDSAAEPDQLRRVVRAILLSGEFESIFGAKVRRPFELVVGAVRAMGADFSLPIENVFSGWFFWLLYTTGNLPHTWAPPTGFPDRKEIWLTTNALVTSWRMVNLLAGLELDGWRPCDPVRSTPAEPRSATALADYWIDRVLLGPVGENSRQEIVDFMAQDAAPERDLDLENWRIQERLRSMVALVLMSPDFNAR